VCDAQSAMMRRWSAAISGPQNWPGSGAHRQGKMVLSHADTCTPELQCAGACCSTAGSTCSAGILYKYHIADRH